MDYETLLTLLQSRRSVRQFAERAVDRADLERLFEAARWAPSNHNRQAWRFLVLTDSAPIRALAQAVDLSLAARLRALPAVAGEFAASLREHASFFARAPVLVIALHRQPVAVASGVLHGLREPSLVSGEPLSTAMAVQNLLLAAGTLGLGACVLTAPLLAGEAIERQLAIPSAFEITCLVALGYPAETPAAPRRKCLDQFVEYH